MRTRLPPAWISGPLVLALLGTASPALALERQWHLGLDAVAASPFAGSDGHPGFGGGAHLAYGLNDWLNLELGMAVAHHLKDGPTVLGATAAAYYTIDVIEWIPYFGIFAGGYRFAGDVPGTSLGGGLALGLDYQFHRSFSAGAQARLHEVFAKDPLGMTTYGTLALRIEYLWGF